MRDDEADLFEPDKNRLDEELVLQPKLYHRAADELAEAKNGLRIAEFRSEQVKVELNLKVRKDPKAFGCDKLTEDVVKNAVLAQEEYKSAKTAEIKAQYKVDRLVAKVRAFEHRKSSIEELVALRLADYFGEPRIKADDSRKMGDRGASQTLERLKTKKKAEDD